MILDANLSDSMQITDEEGFDLDDMDDTDLDDDAFDDAFDDSISDDFGDDGDDF